MHAALVRVAECESLAQSQSVSSVLCTCPTNNLDDCVSRCGALCGPARQPAAAHTRLRTSGRTRGAGGTRREGRRCEAANLLIGGEQKQRVERDGGDHVDEEPALEVVDRHAPRMRHDLVVLIHERRAACNAMHS